ncbi:MAG: class I SAM-dependent methyltransferase [Dehalococcoidia bacterium]
MPNERQFKLRTKFVATRDVHEYRATIPVWVNQHDVVLEIGCEWGTTSVLLAEQCKELIATDVSLECIERAREKHAGIHYEVLDAFNVPAALAFAKQFTKIYVDISGFSGYRSLLDVIALLNMYGTILKPEAIVVKSGALKHFASHCIPWREPQEFRT